MTWFGWAVLAVFGIVAVSGIFTPSVVKRVARDLRLEESDSLQATGRWNGRDVVLNLSSHSDRNGSWWVGTAAIAATSSCRFRAAHVSRTTSPITGPPRVESQLIPETIEVWCDAEALVQQIFSDPIARERLQITLRSPHDLVEIQRAQFYVETDISRFDGEYTALMAAWNAARTLVERLGPAIPEGGRLPLLDVDMRV